MECRWRMDALFSNHYTDPGKTSGLPRLFRDVGGTYMAEYSPRPLNASSTPIRQTSRLILQPLGQKFLVYIPEVCLTNAGLYLQSHRLL